MYCLHCQKEYEKEMFCPECGYKNVEITDIENEVNRTNYVKEIKTKRQYGHKNFLHKNRTSELSTFEENMEVA